MATARVATTIYGNNAQKRRIVVATLAVAMQPDADGFEIT